MIEFILEVLGGIFIGWAVMKLVEGYLRAKLRRQIQEQVEDAMEEVKDTWIMVNVEKHGDVFYLYEKETDQFIAQGKTMEEISQRCQERFKDRTIIADENELKALGLSTD